MTDYIFNRCCVLLLFIFFFANDAVADIEQYQSAKTDYINLLNESSALPKDYDNVASKFYSIFSNNADDPLADDSLYFASQMYYKKYLRYNDRNDLLKTFKCLKLLSSNYNTRLSSLAYLQSAKIYSEHKDYVSARYMLKKVIQRFPDSDDAKTAEHELAALGNFSSSNEQSDPDSEIKSINYNSIKNEVVIALSREAAYRSNIITAEDNRFPERYYIDIFDVSLDIEERGLIEFDDTPIRRIRWAENNPGVFRVVLDNLSVNKFITYTQKNPYRIVISLSGENSEQIEDIETLKQTPLSKQANKSIRSGSHQHGFNPPEISMNVPKNVHQSTSVNRISDNGNNDFIENILGQGLALAFDGVKAFGKFMLGDKEEGDYFINKAVSQMRDNNYLQQNFYMALFIIGQGTKTWDKHIDGNVYTISDEISSEAVKVGASGVIVTHNVFSGNLVPADDDYYLLKLLDDELSRNGIEIYDFIMTNRRGYFSLRTASESKLQEMIKFIVK